MTTDSTATVTFVVTQLERISGAGRLEALATVEIDFEGVVILLQGVQVVRQRGRISAQAPRFRDPRSGRWLPAVVLPDELGRAIAEKLRQMLVPRSGPLALSDILGTPLGELIEESIADGRRRATSQRR